MRSAVLLLLLPAVTGCGEGKQAPPEFSDDYFVGRTVQFVPDEPLGGVEMWWYDLDVELLERQSDGSPVKVEGIKGCNNEQSYTATGWEFDNETDAITIHFGSEWEEYTIVEVNDVERPVSGRFEYDSSPGVEMVGEWHLGVQNVQCMINYSTDSSFGTTSSDAFCDCLHCAVTDCDFTISDGSCCSDATFFPEPTE